MHKVIADNLGWFDESGKLQKKYRLLDSVSNASGDVQLTAQDAALMQAQLQKDKATHSAALPPVECDEKNKDK